MTSTNLVVLSSKPVSLKKATKFVTEFVAQENEKAAESRQENAILQVGRAKIDDSILWQLGMLSEDLQRQRQREKKLQKQQNMES
jgi:hypothetical protein